MMARYTQLQEKDIWKIATFYELTVQRFEPIAGGAGNSSYLLQTPEEKVVLTIFDEHPWQVVVRLGRLLCLLEKVGFPTTRPLRSNDGALVKSYQGKPVMLKSYIRGHNCKPVNESELCQIGAATAKLHQIPPPDYLPHDHSFGLKAFPTVTGRGINPAYESWLDQQIIRLKKYLPTDLPAGLIHGDLFFDNILCEHGEFKAIIDFEEACFQTLLFDLGMGIVGLCADGEEIMLDQAQALVKGYQQIRPLAEDEKESLQLMVEYAATATSFWRFWKYCIDTPMPEKGNSYQQMVAVAERVAAVPKARFMSVFS